MTAQSQSERMWRKSRTKVIVTSRCDFDISEMDYNDNGLSLTSHFMDEDSSCTDEDQDDEMENEDTPNAPETDNGDDEKKKRSKRGSCSNNEVDNTFQSLIAAANEMHNEITKQNDYVDAMMCKVSPVHVLQENLAFLQTNIDESAEVAIDSVDTALSRNGKKQIYFEEGDTHPQKQSVKYASHTTTTTTTTTTTNAFKNNAKEKKKPRFAPSVKFGWFDFFVGILSIVLFFGDIGTDIELAVHYFRNNMLVYGGVTTGMIVVPSLVTCFLGLHWYIIDCNKEKKMLRELEALHSRAKVNQTPNYVWCLRFFFTLLQCGPAIRVIEYLYYGYKSRSKKIVPSKRRLYYRFMLYQDTDSCLLRLFESFLEAAPQLTWQLYIFIDLKPKEDVAGSSIRALAMLSSWGSLALSLTSYHKSLRNSHKEKAIMKLKSLPVYFIWRACETGGRILCIAMFASAFKLWVFGPLIFHWIFMSGWLVMQQTNFYKNMCMEKVFNIICGYVMIFCFLNLREGQTRFRFLLFYFILYAENLIMLALWFRFTQDLGAWFHLWGFIVVLLLFVLHVLVQLIYYVFLHPTNNIKICIKCTRAVVCSSICYEIQPVDIDPAIQSKRLTSAEAVVEGKRQENVGTS